MGRLGVSALSKELARTAVPEELMVDKSTGQMLIKTPDKLGGNIVSFDATLASKLHYDRFRNFITMTGFIGNIYSIGLNTTNPLPTEILDTDVLIDTPMSITEAGLYESFIISVDAITLITGADKSEIGPEPTITIGLTYTTQDGSIITIEDSLKLIESSTKIFIKSEIEELHGPVTDVTLNKIQVNTDPSITGDHQTLLFGALLFIESEE